MFTTILTSSSITVAHAALLSAVSLALGAVIAAVYAYRSAYSKSFLTTLILLPLLVQVVIMMVNGNLGTGVAIAGAFALIRFRSAPATAKEISAVFFAMAAGLAAGMGYLTFAVFFTLLAAAVLFLVTLLPIARGAERCKTLRVTVPENLEFNGMFDDLFAAHTKEARLLKVKTSGMGSLYELTYGVTMKKDGVEKALLDELRRRNGNLPVSLGVQQTITEEL